jgi:hypothetical protein
MPYKDSKKNKECLRLYRLANAERIHLLNGAWIKRNILHVRARARQRMRKFRARGGTARWLKGRSVAALRDNLTRGIRHRIREALKTQNKSCPSLDLIGCSAAQYKTYLEALFLPGMSWANRSLWHIDHKKPLASFDLSTEAGQCAAFHYSNTQPLWAIDNLRKGARVV